MTSDNEHGPSSDEKQSAAILQCVISALWNSKDEAHLITTLRSQIGANEEYLSQTLLAYMRRRCRWPLQAASGRRWTCLAHGSGQLELLLTSPST